MPDPFRISFRIEALERENKELREENEQLKSRLKPEVAAGQWWVFESLALGTSNSTVIHRLFVMRDDTKQSTRRYAVVEDGVVRLFFGETWHARKDLERLLHSIAEPVVEGDFEEAIAATRKHRESKREEFLRKRSSDSAKDLAGV